MKNLNGQMSIFDIVLDRNKELPYIEPPAVSEPVKTGKPIVGGNNLCPYPIPTVKDIIKLIDSPSYAVNKSKLISDVFECGALAISNLVDFTKYDEREKRYLEIINTYKPAEQKLIADIFSRIFALCSSVTYDDGVFGDYLGELFMKCNQGNKNAGQYFTPYHVSKLMAKITVTDGLPKQDGIITINDCCSGGGGLLLAALDALKNDYGVNYAYNCYMDAGDIDARCVHMTYLALSLAGVPAVVKHQDVFSRELWSVWKTPALIFQYRRFHKYLNLN